MARGKAKTAMRGSKKGVRATAMTTNKSKKGTKKNQEIVEESPISEEEIVKSSESEVVSEQEVEKEQIVIKEPVISKKKKSKKDKKAKKAEKAKSKKAKKQSTDEDEEEDKSEESESDDVLMSVPIAQKNISDEEEEESEQEDENINISIEPSDEEVSDNSSQINKENEQKETSESSQEELPKKLPNKIKRIEPTNNEGQNRGFNNTSNENPPSTRVYISNLSKNANSQSIQEFFEENNLETVDLYVPGSDKFHKGFAFAEFADIETAKKATQLSGKNIADSPIEIAYARPKKNEQNDRRNDSFKQNRSGYSENRQSYGNGPTNILFVKGLAYETTESQLKEHFSGAKDIRMMKNQDGSCKGHAYIEYENQSNASNAKEEMTGSEIGGARLILDFAQPRSQQRNDGGFQRRDSFRGGHRGGYSGGFRGGREDGGFRGSRFQRGGRGFGGGRDFGGRGGFGNRGRYGGVGKASRGFNQGGSMGKRIQFNDDDD